jgi:hypothetical protein
LAQLHSIDLNGIQLTLLRKWLAFSTTSQINDVNAMEETFYEDFITCDNDSSRGDGLSDEYVARWEFKKKGFFYNIFFKIISLCFRAHYILSSWSSEESIQLLITELRNDGYINRVILYTKPNKTQLFVSLGRLITPENNYKFLNVSSNSLMTAPILTCSK